LFKLVSSKIVLLHSTVLLRGIEFTLGTIYINVLL